MKKLSDNFLRDELDESGRISYMDGFRFGFGMFVANLLGILVVGGIVYAIAKLMHLA